MPPFGWNTCHMSKQRAVSYQLAADGGYRIENYDLANPFCSFLPGIAGADGVPLWCLYVNRGQAVVSCGVESKDRAIMEFLPATWAYQLAGIQGFRTFCKIGGAYCEPFRDPPTGPNDVNRCMVIEPDLLELHEINATFGLTTRVRYFSPVNEVVGSLVRIVEISNIASAARELALLDGLPVIVPAGLTDQGLKSLRHISEAYAEARRPSPSAALYTAKVVAHDEAEVTPVTGGNFFAGWMRQGDRVTHPAPIVDPGVVFGAGNDLVIPRRFIDEGTWDPAAQLMENRLPCGFLPIRTELAARETIELVTLIGHAPNERMLADYLGRLADAEAIATARAASRAVVGGVTAPAFTVSSQPVFDAYARQNYLDNVLRGGVPLLLPSADGAACIHLYARRHGDLERDYNHFVLPPNPLSSGAGNYRDICQNRRCDGWFYADVAEHELRMFVELLQADGFNPLAVEGYRWLLADEADARACCPTSTSAAQAEFVALVRRPYRPGELLAWAQRHGVDGHDDAWFRAVLKSSRCRLSAHGHEGGYWIDHWTYIVDMLEQFDAVYPDRVAKLLHRTQVGWFDEGAYVRPRAQKYMRRPAGLMQLEAVCDTTPTGPPLPVTTIFGKLCALLAVKILSLDAHGRGVEMEAGRPAWNDAMNGLPALFGSSMCETAEIARLAGWLQRHAGGVPDTAVPAEVADLLAETAAVLALPQHDWERCAAIREEYRRRIRFEPSGAARTVAGAQLTQLLGAIERQARQSVADAIDPHAGLLHTYFVNEPQDGTTANAGKAQLPTRFAQRPLPLFLEGQVHWLRLIDQPVEARRLHERVRSSDLFDAELQMYKVNEALSDWPHQIGRARTFTRGWFENESIWLHMSYKYLLELLRAGLHAEFFTDLATMLVPFMDPQRYGRSILENSSFLGSSANPDPGTHGRGFIARLSGSSAEFIHIWLLLTVGPRPFRLVEGQLCFAPQPALPGAWFTEAATTITWQGATVEVPRNAFACALLGATLLVYHNETRGDTFGPGAVKPTRYLIDQREEVGAAEVSGELAALLRARDCRRLDVYLA